MRRGKERCTLAAKKGAKNGAKKAAAARSQKKRRETRTREIQGVALIALGVLMAAYLFFSAAGTLGEWTSAALFGLIGVTSYALPFILIAVGVINIRGGANERLDGSGWFLLLGLFALVSLIQTIHAPKISDVKWMEYIDSALNAGKTTHLGGGFLGATLAYPMLKLGGGALAYTVTIVLTIICTIAVTGVSIRDLLDKAGDKLSASDDVEEEPDEPRIRKEAAQTEMYSITLADEANPPREPKPKKQKRAKAPTLEERMDAALDYMPPSGPVKTKTGKKPSGATPEPVKLDPFANVDFEPVDDVPLPVKKGKTDAEKKPALLPDPTPLFGAQEEKTDKRSRTETRVPGAYVPPSIELLDKPGAKKTEANESPEEKARILIDTLDSFGIAAKVTEIIVGPALTRIEIQPAAGVRLSRITSLTDNITMALSAPRLRMEAPVPGKNAVGIEIPNKNSVLVALRDVVDSREFRSAASPITMAFGKDASGKIIVADLAKMPHLLIAGATGSGKSVCINDIIISLVYKSSPEDVRFVLIDPKMVEMTMYAALPHLLIPVVTDAKKAASALRWSVQEMERRYRVFAGVKARNIDRYNEEVKSPADRLPRIVVVIDEFADLMMVAPDDVEESVQRIAQLGRAAGIHLILATQRPDATVITGTIKANIPSRCAFAVSSATNSRIILDMTGAEKLRGNGDMLFHPDGSAKPVRLQCSFISDEEVERVIGHFGREADASAYDNAVMDEMATIEKTGATGDAFGEGKQEDDLLGPAVRVGLEHGQISTSMIQRRLRVGYTRASRLIDIMESAGYISGYNGPKPREMIITRAQYMDVFGDETPLAGGDDEAD